jgi:hypothetical protein
MSNTNTSEFVSQASQRLPPRSALRRQWSWRSRLLSLNSELHSSNHRVTSSNPAGPIITRRGLPRSASAGAASAGAASAGAASAGAASAGAASAGAALEMPATQSHLHGSCPRLLPILESALGLPALRLGPRAIRLGPCAIRLGPCAARRGHIISSKFPCPVDLDLSEPNQKKTHEKRNVNQRIAIRRMSDRDN